MGQCQGPVDFNGPLLFALRSIYAPCGYSDTCLVLSIDLIHCGNEFQNSVPSDTCLPVSHGTDWRISKRKRCSRPTAARPALLFTCCHLGVTYSGESHAWVNRSNARTHVRSKREIANLLYLHTVHGIRSCAITFQQACAPIEATIPYCSNKGPMTSSAAMKVIITWVAAVNTGVKRTKYTFQWIKHATSPSMIPESGIM